MNSFTKTCSAKINSNAKRQRTSNRARGFSLIELLIVVVIIGIIAAVAVPNLLASRRSANGASAIESMRLFHSTQASYRAGVGSSSFGTVEDLFLQDLIDPVLANAAGCGATTSIGSQNCVGDGAPKSGYNFDITYSPPTNTALSQFTATGYAAGSVGIARTGDRNFFIDESGVIRASITATVAPDASSTPLNN